ncbi:MAG: phosphatase PAP2 family protein, partial [Candidatus Peregrinibacteria bacterium]|nr:phosphatase PAP2 family protein [Candidatus Peregrinibacteria bacterium]
LVFAILVSLSRIYEFVHFPVDIAAGILIGGVSGVVFANKEFQKFLLLSWNHLEFRRQSFHFTLGFLVVFAHWIGFLRIREIAIILALGLTISIISQIKRIPIISEILELFDRPRDHDFPGRGAFYFLLGVFLSFWFFPVEIAYASILIMSVGDSLNHLFVRNIGFWQTPWNPKKNWIGVGLGIVTGVIAAQFFVPLQAAIIATTIAIILETVTLKIGNFFIDDNIIVPLSAGFILQLILV